MPKDSRPSKKPYVAIFGDVGEHALTKTIWSLLSRYELQLENVTTVEELTVIAPGAVLIIMLIDGAGDNRCRVARELTQSPRVVADIVAITNDADVAERMQILAQGFDAIFNLSFMEYPDFKNILLNRVEKGFIRLENRIQQEEYRRFTASLAASPDAFIIFDEYQKIFFVSEHYKNAYPVNGHRFVRGLPVADAFEIGAAEQGVLEGDPRYAQLKKFWLSLEGETEFEHRKRIWHVKAKKLPQGLGTIVTTTDITRYRRQQTELEEKQKNLSDALHKEQEAGAIQKQFINMVSHEFRTPLSIIDGNAQILSRRARTLDETTIQKRARTIRSAVSRLVNMMEGVLSSNMLETGRLTLMREPVDLAAMITELCEEHADLASAHEITCDVAGLKGDVMLDRKLFGLVIGNLLSNAVKFSPDIPVIRVKAWQQDATIFIECRDRGIGIPSNEISKIFERFYRTTIASGIPGTGIGLSLAKELVELHGGTIAVESIPGEGTIFNVRVPVEAVPT